MANGNWGDDVEFEGYNRLWKTALMTNEIFREKCKTGVKTAVVAVVAATFNKKHGFDIF